MTFISNLGLLCSSSLWPLLLNLAGLLGSITYLLSESLFSALRPIDLSDLQRIKDWIGLSHHEVPALVMQELLTLPRVGKRLSALGLGCAFLSTEVGQLR